MTLRDPLTRAVADDLEERDDEQFSAEGVIDSGYARSSGRQNGCRSSVRSPQ